ncbi:Flp pilus assembly protein CpaB [Glaciimonas sp. Gout2]|uniref:Flp pilus assembly protein CpaB n=1 Tax=unclassified Glaciimonas TaxID=2644401 RepID=UPI002B23E9D8|nr:MULTISPECIES: Flp pilus assembly protein CpaB [unclassified Glaciimonas]MEB0013577.1 Flp pilus assembly protein CpaB [Glaciimonas sp. Cout2]MEB0083222.1 Flp pilus assembly protein CpaB [Glaciimonas sp. Gout2]
MNLKRYINPDKIKKALPLIVILLIAALAVFLANSYLKSRSSEIEKSLSDEASKVRTTVTVPRMDLSPGDILTMDQLASRTVPKEYMNFDAITPEQIDAYIGKKIIRPVRKGTPLLESYFLLYESVPFSKSIDAGDRAITIPVDEINSFSGLLRAGDHIDLFYMMKRPPDGPQMPTPGPAQEDTMLAPLLENVEIRATGQTTEREVLAADRAKESGFGDRQSQPGRTTYSTVTISVPAADAQKVILVQTGARIVAVLRRPDDVDGVQKKLFLSDVLDPGAKERFKLPQGPQVDYIIGGRFKTGEYIDGGDDQAKKIEALKRFLGTVGNPQ